MANVYVRSAAAGAGTGVDWANAFTTLAAALTAGSTGNSYFVSEDHAESQAVAVTMTSPGVSSSPCFAYCVNHLGSVPPVSADLRTTATIATTGNNTLSIQGYLYCYGITFTCGSGANAPALTLCLNGNGWQKYDSCGFVLGGTSASTLLIGDINAGRENKVEWINTTYQVSVAGSVIVPRNTIFTWKKTASAIAGATLPTKLFGTTSPSAGAILLEGIDLSALGSGNTIVPAILTPIVFNLKDCKLGASVTVAATATGPGSAYTVVSRCDSSGTNYRTERYDYLGTQTTETTIIRTGGASDGATGISWKLVTTANSKWVVPFEAMPIAIWSDTAGSPVTVTLYGIWGGGAVPNNDDIWMDVEYLGASGNPQGSFATTSKADNLAAGSALTSDASTWGGSTTKFKMSVTVTPQQKGYMSIYVKAAAASQTFYIDPLVVLS